MHTKNKLSPTISIVLELSAPMHVSYVDLIYQCLHVHVVTTHYLCDIL